MTIEELQEQLTKAANSIQKLEAKNEELIGKLKNESARADDAESATGTELEKATKRADKAERDLKAAAERAEKSDKALRSFREEAAIANILTAHKVQADDYRAVKAILKLELDPDTEEPTIGGKSLEDYAKGYFAKEGKKYTQAADHNGGGATGSEGSKAGSWSKAPETPDELHNWMKYSATNKDEATALANTWQRADLRP